MAQSKFIATVYAPDGTVMQRHFKGKPVGALIIERDSPHRAWLTARGIPDKPTDWPPGVTIRVEEHRPPMWGFQPDPTLAIERKWDGKQWVEVATGAPVE